MNIEEQFITDLSTPFHKIYTFPNGNSIFLGSQLAVGGFPDKWNYTDEDYQQVKQKLLDNNIKSVVCCAELYKLFDELEFLHIPMESNDDFNITYSCNTAWKWISERLQTNSVLIHCNAGCHRSATITIGYIAASLNISIEESYNLVKNKRTCVHIDNFLPQLNKIIGEK